MRLLLSASLALLICGSPASASIVLDDDDVGGYEFANLGEFDGDGAGHSAGPFLDPDTGVLATLTTIATAGGAINEVADGLGIGDTMFDTGESWTFSWNVGTFWEAIDFDRLTDLESMTVQSAAFIGLVLTPGSPGVAFDSITGTFTFTTDGPDFFEIDDISGGALLFVAANTEITIAAGPGTSSDVSRLQFGAVPEPSSLMLLGLGAFSLAAVRRRRTDVLQSAE